MLLVVPDAGLHEVLASQVLLFQLWPAAARDIMMLIDVLRHAYPSLADVLAIGLIVLVGPGPGSAMVLRYGRVSVTATGSGDDGVRLPAPCGNPRQVTRIEVHDVAVDGSSVLR